MSDTLDSRYCWTRLAFLLAIATVVNVAMWSVIVVLPALQAEFGGGRGDASLPYPATIVGMALGGWMSGWIYDMTGSCQLAFLNGIVWNAANIAIMLVLVLLLSTRRPRKLALA